MRGFFFIRVLLFFVTVIFSLPLYPETYIDDDWEVLSPNWTNGIITSIVKGSNYVYCGGAFTNINGVSANRVARWDGGQWQAMGQGFNGPVEKLCINNNGTLFACGSFTQSGSSVRNRIAQWNSTSWISVGTGFNDVVYSMIVLNNNTLFVGGKFTKSGDNSINLNHIAYWNGSTWIEPNLGVGSTGDYVTALCADGNGNVYAGGKFSSAGYVYANNIAKWDGTNWSSLGTGVNGDVYALAIGPDGKLYVGGDFSFAGGISVNKIAIWDGYSWSALDLGVNGIVNVILLQTANSIFMGGLFNYTGNGIGPNHLAWWYQGNWKSITTGITGISEQVKTLFFDSNGDLYVGGSFYYAGGKISYNIAKLKKPPIFTLTYTANTGGSISGETTQNIMRGNNGTEVIAVPDSGYKFDRWSDGLLTPNRIDTNITGNGNYMAYFVILNEGQPEGEGISEGSMEGEGYFEGEPEGEGMIEGEIEGIVEGIIEGEGMVEGSGEGNYEGATEGSSDGMIEGLYEGEGMVEGTTEGIEEGITEGEGVEEGESELIAWIDGETYIHKVVGESHTFTVYIQDFHGDVSYEWYHCKDYLCSDPTIIFNALGQELYLEELSIEDTGWYWCQVSDDFNVIETNRVYLHVSHGLSVGMITCIVAVLLLLICLYSIKRQTVY